MVSRVLIGEKDQITVGYKNNTKFFLKVFMNIEIEKYFLKMVVFMVILSLPSFSQGTLS